MVSASIWIYTLVSVFIVSIISLIGIVTLSLKDKILHKLLLIFVSFSTGALMGDAFIHLIPGAIALYGPKLAVFVSVLVGILAFFVLEKFIHWRHCHEEKCKVHTKSFVYLNLIGDGFHNFIDGVVMAGTYLVSIPLGITTTLAVMLHEIPQEIGDFGVLVHGGLTKFKALFFNFLSALTAILGAVLTLIIGRSLGDNMTTFLLPFTAGGFIYIAGSDLIPELHKEMKLSRSALQFIAMLAGIGLMFLLLMLE